MPEHHRFYASAKPQTAEDFIYQISALAAVGAGASDTALNIEHMQHHLCTVFEQIYELAAKAIDDLATTNGKATPSSIELAS